MHSAREMSETAALDLFIYFLKSANRFLTLFLYTDEF